MPAAVGTPSFFSGLFTGHDPTREKLAGRVGSGQQVFEISRVGSGLVGSGVIQISRVGLGHPAPIRPAISDLARESLIFPFSHKQSPGDDLGRHYC